MVTRDRGICRRLSRVGSSARLASGGIDAYLCRAPFAGRRGLRVGRHALGDSDPAAFRHRPLSDAGASVGLDTPGHGAGRRPRRSVRWSCCCANGARCCCSDRVRPVSRVPSAVPGDRSPFATRCPSLPRRVARRARLRACRRFTVIVAVPFVVAALIVAVPGAVAYGRDPHPAFRAIADAVQRGRVQPPAGRLQPLRRTPAPAGCRYRRRSTSSSRRPSTSGSARWTTGVAAAPLPSGFSRTQRRTDLALIDPHSRHDVVRYRWTVEQRPELSGTRPLGVDWYRFAVPGWFAGQGWSLTPETGGITQATASGTGPPADRSVGPPASRAFHLLVGARHLGNAGDADAEACAHDRWRGRSIAGR